jgi:hypothetical protein
MNGRKKWQIAEPDALHAINYFTSIYISEDKNQLMGYNLNGVDVTINILNGSVLNKELIR